MKERQFTIGDYYHLQNKYTEKCIELFELERLYKDQQTIIERYQEHYAKWGTFYKDFADKHPVDKVRKSKESMLD